jgi:3-dehydrosphinganine reductase
MDWLNNKTILITGGSSGIGLSLAKICTQHNARLLLVGRSHEKLNAAKTELNKVNSTAEVLTYSCDVSVKENVKGLITYARGKWDKLDFLVCNAGIGHTGLFQNLSIEAMKESMDVNYFGSLYCVKYAWSWLVENKGSHVIFTSSIAGYAGLIGYTAYAPSKFALVGLAECLRMESKKVGISISIVYPPDTETPMLENERKNAIPETKKLSEKGNVMKADKVAMKYVEAMKSKKFDIYCNAEGLIFRKFKGITPSFFYRFVDGIVKNV